MTGQARVPGLLDLLDEHEARATFFVCGANVRRLPAVARELSRGVMKVANHTESHAALYLKGGPFIRQQVVPAQEAIASADWGELPTLFRPPVMGALAGFRRGCWRNRGSGW